jgi:hypothetical protein
MAISYSDPSKKQKLRQPLFKRHRAYYRGPRKSSKENLISNQMYVDLERIYIELEDTANKIISDVQIILDKEQDDEVTTMQSDSSRVFSFESLNNISFYSQWKDTEAEHSEFTNLPTLDTISSRLSRIKLKLNRLES